MKKVLVSDALSATGLSPLKEIAQVDVKTGLKPEELVSIIGEYDALLVRSQTQVTADIINAGKKLQVIGRAGVGVDNIDLKAATGNGIIVVNAPTGNTISATEHTLALMLSMARHIPRANASLKSGQWKRNEFIGSELKGKTLGIVGLGNIGSEIAKRALALEMRVIGYDPFISMERAKKLQVELVPFEDLLKQADFITLHVPMTGQTKGLIGPKELEMMKPTVRLINTSRGGIIDEEALAAAIKEKRIGGAAIDVFSKEPCTESCLFECDNIIVTPHLGASTAEAQELATSDVVKQVIDVFEGRPARYAVNAPYISAESLPVVGPFMPVARTVGSLVSQLTDGHMKNVTIKYCGELAAYDTTALKALVLGGILEHISEERVNVVNADIVASQRGLGVTEQKESACQNFSSLITVTIDTDNGKSNTVAGSLVRGDVHIVRLNDYWIDIVPTGGYFLFADHIDRPGLIGAAGKITGDADINISYMHLSRQKARGQALMILALDEPLPEKQRQQLLSLPDVQTVQVVKI
ncbi:MAG: phosphoglycerate dehydrogenase [Dehalococcoides mccartyi]|jgi:D-3-phosphoglycerate dehydrogenase|uniref:D-3-phosphoglycerate dehydrogenase n=2 Tax=root TaxID=1 RepID=A0AB38ZAV4_9CHLR|nr:MULTISPECIES: phosphoglycerate dehydrogenase [Dehalococcoides]AQU02986.1 phosphoglycerate dehydrogenase [Dehalococcoides mccartyi]AQU04303.1 phosphoglycerate dehydrogenase [Dehalococcoides mccartyi]MDP4279972.1 phosphoglycerate dehydrogenase [Dehalococcoides mccartyi]MEA4879412.1 phosphoglycerate dehydrogenase [Dehalococcoides mccartyi]OBW62120.1 MAG: phosphoglycerate dehydrogenase [Dehalococcoides mccartyi]